MKERYKHGEGCVKICGGVDVPTKEEVNALRAMRRIKERVRDLRTRLSAISSGTVVEKPGERGRLEHEMQRLKSEWESWEQEREKATHERMVLLGHEEPFPPDS